MKNRISKQASTACKTALTLFLISASVLTAVGCDRSDEPDASADAATDTNETPSVTETEAFTYPEIETEAYQAHTMEELNVGFFKDFSLEEALKGKYLNSYNTHVYGNVLDYYNEGSYMNWYVNRMSREKADEYMEVQTNVITKLNDFLLSENKDFTITFELANSIYHTYSLTVNDENGVFMLSAQDKYTGEERLISGIIGDEYYYSTQYPFLTSSNSGSVTSYLQSHSFSELSSNLLAFLPAHIMPHKIYSIEGSKCITTLLSERKSLDEDIFDRGSNKGTDFLMDFSGDVPVIEIISRGVYVKGGSTRIPIDAKLVSMQIQNGMTSELVAKTLAEVLGLGPAPETEALG